MWEVKTLGEVLEVQNGFAFNSKEFSDTEGKPLIRIRDLKNGKQTKVKYTGEYDERFVVTSGDLLIGMDGEFRCYQWKGDDALLNQRVCRLQGFSKEVFANFLFYGLNKYLEDIEAVTAFTTVKHISSKQIKEIKFPLPPLTEQKRIVAVLDDAFAGIDQAIENTEAARTAAQEVFDSNLNAIFTQRGDGWVEKRLGDCFRLKSGDNLTAKNMIEGDYPVYGGNGLAGYHNLPNLSGDNVVIGRVGALCGNVRHVTEEIWLTDNAFKIVDKKFSFDNQFLTYLLNYKNLRSLARQAAQPVISNNSLASLVLEFPLDIKTQTQIVQKLDSLASQRDTLVANYTQKLAHLQELKQSLLQQAFSGNLTGKKEAA